LIACRNNKIHFIRLGNAQSLMSKQNEKFTTAREIINIVYSEVPLSRIFPTIHGKFYTLFLVRQRSISYASMILRAKLQIEPELWL